MHEEYDKYRGNIILASKKKKVPVRGK